MSKKRNNIEESEFSKYATNVDEETIQKNTLLRKQKRDEYQRGIKKKKNFNAFKNMKMEIEGYGFHYSFVDFMKVLALFMVGTCFVGVVLKMKPVYICALIIVEILLLIPIIKSQYKFVYEQRRFNDLITYMKQMSYSFKKDPKILLALEDTEQLVEGKMKKLVQEAIEHINTSNSPYMYEEALDIIFNEYSCSRLAQLHDFIIKIEETGGNYQNSMNVLIDDTVNWSQRIYEFQIEKADIKKNILISLCLAMAICSTTLFMIPEQMDFTQIAIYQIVSFAALSIFLGLYTISQVLLNTSWIDDDTQKDPEKIRKEYRIATGQQTILSEKQDKVAAILIGIAGLVYGIITRKYYWIPAGVLLGYYCWQNPKRKYKKAVKNTKREIEKVIPGWCREIALNLQTENVFQAIAMTEATCPIVLEEPVHKLIEDLQARPGDVVVYNSFLFEFNIPEVGQMMNTLYALSESGVSDVDAQINKIIESNNKLVEKAETLKNEDSNAGIGFLTLLPMVIGSAKMLVDLALLITNFVALTGL